MPLLATHHAPLGWAPTLHLSAGGDATDALDTLPSQGPDRAAWSDTLPGLTGGIALCVQADDVGLHPGVNGAVTDLVLRGRVQALACRVGAPAWPAMVEHLQRLRTLSVDLGLQIDLSRFPLDAGTRRPLRSWLLGVGLPERARLRRELQAQFDAFEAALGQAPHFVASYRHVHQLAGVRELVMEEIERRYASGQRPWVRQAQRGDRTGLPEGLRAWAAERRGAAQTAEAARAIGARHNRALLGVYDFKGGPVRYRSLLQQWLSGARDGELLVCHPSLPSVARDRLLAARMAEYRLLSGSEWPALQERLALNLQPMSSILAKRSRW